jgi:hypothetical protein
MKIDSTFKLLIIAGFISLLAVTVPIILHSGYWINISSIPVTLFIIVLALTILTRYLKISKTIKFLIIALIIPFIAPTVFALTEVIRNFVFSGNLSWYYFINLPNYLRNETMWLLIILPTELIFCCVYGLFYLIKWVKAVNELMKKKETQALR